MDIKNSNIPKELRRMDQWLCWKVGTRDGKETKIPKDPNTGGFGSTKDSDTWAPFPKAMSQTAKLNFDGVGFVFSQEADYVGIDLDDCRNPETGEWDEWALEAINEIGSWTEISPSGTGAHIILKGEIPGHRNRKGDVEMYEDGRFFTITGNLVDTDGNPISPDEPPEINSNQKGLNVVYEKHLRSDDDDEDESEQKEIDTKSSDWDHVDIEDGDRPKSTPGEANLDQLPQHLQDIVKKAKGSSNGYKFNQLWLGRWEDIYPNESHSEADIGFCDLLAFWCSGDPEYIDQVFRASGLYRPKWDEQHYRNGATYGERTIGKAIAKVTDYYNEDHYDKISNNSDSESNDNDQTNQPTETKTDDRRKNRRRRKRSRGKKNPTDANKNQTEETDDKQLNRSQGRRRKPRKSASDFKPTLGQSANNESQDEDNYYTEFNFDSEDQESDSGDSGWKDDEAELNIEDDSSVKQANEQQEEKDNTVDLTKEEGASIFDTEESEDDSNESTQSEDTEDTSSEIITGSELIEEDEKTEESNQDSQTTQTQSQNTESSESETDENTTTTPDSEEIAKVIDSKLEGFQSRVKRLEKDLNDLEKTHKEHKHSVKDSIDTAKSDIHGVNSRLENFKMEHAHDIEMEEDKIDRVYRELQRYEDKVEQKEEEIEMLRDVIVLLCRIQPGLVFDRIEKALENEEDIELKEFLEKTSLHPNGEGSDDGEKTRVQSKPHQDVNSSTEPEDSGKEDKSRTSPFRSLF